MEQHIFTFSLIIEGTKENVFQFIMPIKSFITKTFVSQNKNVFLNTTERFKRQKYLHWHYFCRENIFLMTCSELPPIGLCQYYTKMCSSILPIKIIHQHLVTAKLFTVLSKPICLVYFHIIQYHKGGADKRISASQENASFAKFHL